MTLTTLLHIASKLRLVGAILCSSSSRSSHVWDNFYIYVNLKLQGLGAVSIRNTVFNMTPSGFVDRGLE